MQTSTLEKVGWTGPRVLPQEKVLKLFKNYPDFRFASSVMIFIYHLYALT